MNILLLCDEYPPGKHGGIGTAVQLQAQALVKMGHQVVVAGLYDWGYGGENFFNDEGVIIYRFRHQFDHAWLSPPQTFFRRSIYWLARHTGLLERDTKASLQRYQAFLKKLIIKYRIDIAEIPDYLHYLNFVKGFVPFEFSGVPYIVKLHGNHTFFAGENGSRVSPYIAQAEAALLEKSSGVIAVSKYVAERTQALLGYKKDTIVLYNGIEETEITPAPLQMRKDIVFTGSLLPKKGIFQLIEAWNVIAANFPNTLLHIYGRGKQSDLQAIIHDAVRSQVVFHGAVPRSLLFKALAHARVAVFPSFAESLGLAPLEAMAHGAPTIFTTLTSGPEVIAHEVDGLLADPANTADIAKALSRLLQDDELCARLTTEAFHTLRERFYIPKLMQQHVSFYTRILDANRESTH